MWKSLGTLIVVLVCLSLNGCVGLNTFPQIARSGDTVTIGLGASYLHGGSTELMRPGNTTVTISDGGTNHYTLTNTNGNNGFIRGVFNLFPDPRSYLSNYDTWLNTPSLNYGHPYETVVVVDLPPNIPAGSYTVEVTTPRAGSNSPFISNLVVTGPGGSPDNLYDEWGSPWGVNELANTPFHTITVFSPQVFGAIEMSIGFDKTMINPSDIRIVQFIPNSDGQRSLHWNVDASTATLHVYAIQPLGTNGLSFDVVHPQGTMNAAFTEISSARKVVDLNGNPITGASVRISNGAGVF